MAIGLTLISCVACAHVPPAALRGPAAWPAGVARPQFARAPLGALPMARIAMADEASAPVAKRGWGSRLKSKLMPWRQKGDGRSGETAAARKTAAVDEPGKTGWLPDLSADDVADIPAADIAADLEALRSGGSGAFAEEDEDGDDAEEDEEDDGTDEGTDEEEEEEDLDPILEDSDVERTVWIVDVTKEDGEKERLQVLFDASGKALWETGFPPIPRTGQWNLRPDRLLFTRPFLAGVVGFKETYIAEPSVDATDDLKLRTKGVVRGWGYFSPAVTIGSFVMTRKATNVGGARVPPTTGMDAPAEPESE